MKQEVESQEVSGIAESQSSPFDACDRTHTHASSHATSLMHIKNSMCHFFLWYLLSGTLEWIKLKEKQKHQVEYIIILLHPFLIFCKPEGCYSMYDFRIRGKFWVWSE